MIRLLDWTKPRRLLVKDLAAVVEECKELREAAVRRAMDSEVLRAELRLERRHNDERQGLEHVGYGHSDIRGRSLKTPLCPTCRPVYLGPPTKETPP